MFDPLGLSEWLVEALKALSISIWGLVVPLAGGSDGPLWRWALVELGLFSLLLFGGSLWIAAVLGAGRVRRTPQRSGSAAVFAAVLSFVWNWYAVAGSQAIVLGLHPQEGWERMFFSWGLPMLMAGNIIPAAGFTLHFGIGLVLGAAILFDLGRLWAWANGRWLRSRQREAVPSRQPPVANGPRVDPEIV